MTPTTEPKSLVLFASGRGKNADAIIRYFSANGKARVDLIVCNNTGAGVLDVAREHSVPCILVDKPSFSSDELIVKLGACKPHLIILAGFLWKIPPSIISAFPGKIINIHPALLPKFGGKGMYGSFVHEAVKQAGEKETGITIHYVNEHYDDGARILQAVCPVSAEENAADIAGKVARLEYSFYPKTIEYLLEEQ